MEKYLWPEQFGATSNSSGLDKAWPHWKRTFICFRVESTTLTTGTGASTVTAAPAFNKLDMLINFVSPTLFEYIADY